VILDTSAVVAIALREPGFEGLKEKLARDPAVGIGVPTLTESGIVLSARMRQDARGLLARFLQVAAIATIPFGDAHYAAAVEAWLRYGKGRHPASLNFGDCLAYATAKTANQPLLCLGDDFSKTDLELA
jgi:ribonuclease VapC